ncbi:MAG: Asp-tRNA(Asn)/Glu-tRNA(Gln) amidotransferase subunit GatA [Microgenomates group bacterium]
MDLADLTIFQLQEKLKKKEISCQEIISAFLEKIEKLNPQLNALITPCFKEAKTEAKKWDLLIKKQGNEKLIEKFPLLGVPVVHKDLFVTEGIRTTAGSKVLEDWIPPYDGTVVKKLKEAGAIIVGKANCDAWGHGSSGENSDFGPTKNPYDLTRVPGGSSSGSAVAIAGKMALIATGTDTGGSIRQPAGFCGVVGLKPSYGRVSRFGVIAMASSLDTIGHFTKDVTDSALVLKITAGKDENDATTSPLPVPDYLSEMKKPIKGLKIGIPKEYFIKGIDKRIEKRVLETAKLLEKKGVKIKEISLPLTKYAVSVYYIIQPAEVSSNLARYDGIRFGFGREKFGAEAKRRIMLGTYVLSAGYYDAYYLQAMKVRTLIRQDFQKAFEKVDLILTPVSPSLSFKLGEKISNPLQMYLSDIFTIPASLAGLPGISIPVGLIDNLPVGVQLIAPQFKEELLFQIGKKIEEDWQ